MKTYLRITSTSVAVLLGLACLSMTAMNPFDLLSIDDQEKEVADHDGTPALSSPLNETPQWKSFNTWNCFETNNISLELTEIDEGSMKVPTLLISSDRIQYEFSLDPEPDLDSERILRRWAELLDGQASFCVYAAFLPDLDATPAGAPKSENQAWVVNQLKTGRGTWSYEDDIIENQDVSRESDDEG